MKLRIVLIILAALGIAYLVINFKPAPAAPQTTDAAAPSSTDPQTTGATRLPRLLDDADAVPASFAEAPMLAERVAADALPPIEQRLPAEPAVIAPTDEIGRYGGTWRAGFTGPADGQNIDRIQHNHLLYWSADVKYVTPWIIRAWDVSDEGKTFTFHLRKGMRWSDGHPFTTADIMFWYEDVYQNEQLNPVRANWNQIGGQEGVWEQVDDHTFRVRFSQSYYTFLTELASLGVAGHFTRGNQALGVFAPRHYVKQFHPDFVDAAELDVQVKAEGFETWVQLFKFKNDPKLNPECPVTTPWLVKTPVNTAQMVLERNPYYWVVDTDGNQLPYIDRIVLGLAENLEVLNLRAIAGEYDIQGRHILMEKIPVLLENQQRGNYRVRYWPSQAGTDAGLFFNQTYDGDAEVAHWLADRDFRIALSIGIDRGQLNEIFWLGLGLTGSACPPATVAYSPGEAYRQRHAQFDPDRANQVLDELGLKQRDSKGYRMRRDGAGRLVLEVQTIGAAFINFTGIAENVTEQWRRHLGIQAVVQELERSLSVTRHENNDVQVYVWSNDGSDNPWAHPFQVLPNHVRSWAPLFGRWWQTGGQKGREPTEPARRMVELYEQGKAVPEQERYALGQELLKIYADQAYVIGTVGVSPAMMGVWVVSNDLGNVPESVPFSTPAQTPGHALPEQFFFRVNGADRPGT